MSSTGSKIEALVTADDLPQRLEGALKGWWRGRSAPSLFERAGKMARKCMSPEMSYGRHFGPAPYHARPAAVALWLFRRERSSDREKPWFLPLIERSHTLSHHAGQVSLPGGAVEESETSLHAALRESHEELGFQAPHLVVGQLTECYVFASNFRVTPWIIASIAPVTHWQPHDREVQRVIELPLSVLLDDHPPDTMTIERGPLRFQAPCLKFGNAYIWGATAVILGELAAALRELAR